MEPFIHRYCRLLESLIALALAVMVVLVFANVVLRYAFDTGITISDELSRWLFVWMTYLGAIIGVKEGTHLGTDMLVSRLPRRLKPLCLLAAQALMLFVTWLLLKGSVAQVRINLDVVAPVSGLPMAIFYASGAVFAVSAGGLLLLQAAGTLRAMLRKEQVCATPQSGEGAKA